MVMKLTIVIKFIICLALTFSAALLGSLFTRNAIADWYANLNKPSFNPPDWLFGPVWTALYVLMAVSAAIVWHKGLDKAAVRIALALFLVQLILNGLWTPLFFGLKMPLAAFVEILLLWAAIGLTILAFARVSLAAAVLLLPYILWTSFAAVLNFSIWLLNR
jgi:benzodiazapine receptor